MGFLYPLVLFIVALLEEFVAMMYYKMGAKNYDIVCSVLSIFRTYIFFYIVRSVIPTNDSAFFFLVTIYAIGGGFGNYWSLKFEKSLEEKILKMKRKGRKKKRIFLWLFGKKRT